jgi:ABC-type lipoprotein export system ATPase subunit
LRYGPVSPPPVCLETKNDTGRTTTRHRYTGRTRDRSREHRATEMSGGEMQRVAIARALANRPSILLADEPTGNLDTSSGEEIIALLDDLHREGHTILLVTHNPEIAERMDGTITLRDGQIVEDSLTVRRRMQS